MQMGTAWFLVVDTLKPLKIRVIPEYVGAFVA